MNTLRPPAFRYGKTLRRRWFVAVGFLTLASLCVLFSQDPDSDDCWLRLASMGVAFWITGRILRARVGGRHEPRETSTGAFDRVLLPGPVWGTGWLFRRELQVSNDALLIRSRFSQRSIPRRDIVSVMPLPSELVIELLDGETLRIVTCRLPGSFGPPDVAFDHTMRAAGFAALSYNERIARALEPAPRARTAYRTAA
jgi:hypothetical protein